MGQKYNHLTLEERIEIYRLHADGKSLRKIAKELKRAPSTIKREIERNSVNTKQWSGGYKPSRAHSVAMRRRQRLKRFKLVLQPDLKDQVEERLIMGWSPQQISGQLQRCYKRQVISHESIYRYIYYRTEQKDYWHKYLRRKRFRRGRHSRRISYKMAHLQGRRSVHDKLKSESDRSKTGHWEADLMLFGRSGQAILVSCDRKSRLIIASKQNKSSDQTLENLTQMLSVMPSSHKKTITYDNGTEFAKHHVLENNLGIKSYFCDIKAPWQKGSVENAIGRLRRDLPRKTDLNHISDADLSAIIQRHNNTPRKCLDYKTPIEVFLQQLTPLHFRRESTFPPARE